MKGLCFLMRYEHMGIFLFCDGAGWANLIQKLQHIGKEVRTMASASVSAVCSVSSPLSQKSTVFNGISPLRSAIYTKIPL